MEQATDKQIGFASKLGIANPEQFSKQALREMIDKAMQAGKTTQAPKVTTWQEHKTEPKKYDNSSYYVSYAKDLFVAVVGLPQPAPINSWLDIMQVCVDCIKLAKSQLQ